MSEIVRIAEVRPLEGHRVRLWFTNGFVKDVDLGEALAGGGVFEQVYGYLVRCVADVPGHSEDGRVDDFQRRADGYNAATRSEMVSKSRRLSVATVCPCAHAQAAIWRSSTQPARCSGFVPARRRPVGGVGCSARRRPATTAHGKNYSLL